MAASTLIYPADVLPDASRRSYDPASGTTTVKLFSGDCYVSTAPNEMLVTILGSCVAACIRDPVAGVGGMNHFLLPGSETGEDETGGRAARYGAYAMERLINDLVKAGGIKSRFEVKVFGGGNVIRNSAMIGSKNAAFVRSFIAREGLRLVGSDLEGNQPRRIHYYPDSGRVRMRKLAAQAESDLIRQETAYRASLAAAPESGTVDLF